MLAEMLPEVNPDTGKHLYKFRRSLRNWLTEHPEDEQELRDYGYLTKPIYHDDFGGSFKDFLETPKETVNVVDMDTGELISRYAARKLTILPCGQCLECRCRHAQEWANRIMLESQYHDESYFITLTYDEEHVPIVKTKDGETVLTLRPKDLQDFIKRLRRYQEYHKANKIRYYAVGEYGSMTHRPHYHMIVFGLKLDDLEYIGRNKHGTPLHDSKTLRDLWSNGLTEVDRMTWESAAYCARYTVKKLGKAESDFYASRNLVPEFSRMSLKPAIGYQYYDEHKDEIYKFDEIHISTVKGGRTVKPPRYFDTKYDDIFPVQFAQVKGNRKDIAEKAQVARLSKFSGSYLELLYLNEQKMKARNKLLRRNLE